MNKLTIVKKVIYKRLTAVQDERYLAGLFNCTNEAFHTLPWCINVMRVHVNEHLPSTVGTN